MMLTACYTKLRTRLFLMLFATSVGLPLFWFDEMCFVFVCTLFFYFFKYTDNCNVFFRLQISFLLLLFLPWTLTCLHTNAKYDGQSCEQTVMDWSQVVSILQILTSS